MESYNTKLAIVLYVYLQFGREKYPDSLLRFVGVTNK